MPSAPPVVLTRSQALAVGAKQLAAIDHALAGGPLKKFHPSSTLTKAPGPTGASVLAQLPGALGAASSRLVIGGSTLQRGATAARGSRHANVTKPWDDQRRPVQPWVPIVVTGMFGAVLVLMRLRRQKNVPLS